MKTNKKITDQVIGKLENCLKELKIKTETRSSANESIIFGKFAIEKDKYKIVIHLQEEDFIPKSHDFGISKRKPDKDEDCAITPNLNFQATHSKIKSYTEEEGLKIKKRFLEDAAKVLPKLNR